MATTASVHVRVDTHTKDLAVEAWNKMGLSASAAVRLFVQASAYGRTPLQMKVPKERVIKAMDELEKGGGKGLLLWTLCLRIWVFADHG